MASIEHHEIVGPRLHLVGQAQTRRVALTCGTARTQTVAQLAEVARAQAGLYSFELDLPHDGSRPELLLIDEDGIEASYSIPAISRGQRRLGLLRLAVAFVWRVLRAAPMLLKWRRNRNSVPAMELKQALGIVDTRTIPVMDKSRLTSVSPSPALNSANFSVSIILPAYNAFELLSQALQRVEVHTDVSWHLTIVEDCSTDPRVRPFVIDWSSQRSGNVTLLLNEKNLGFVQSVNRGFDEAAKRKEHVILLNSDALVPPEWASRLLQPIISDAHIATATPMSNNAEIFTVPCLCRPQELLHPSHGDQIDRVAAQYSRPLDNVYVPTGVGFCMALNRSFLDQVPRFDTAFGRGYGEEVDWCQMVSALGGKHICVTNLFVEHRGGSSFGDETKQALIRDHNAIISNRYPDYDRQVQEFVFSDPLATERMVLAMAWADKAAKGPVAIFIGHSMGGGAEMYLQNRINDRVTAHGAAVVLRVGGLARWCIEMHSVAGVSAIQCEEISEVQALIAPLRSRQIIYSNGVGDPFAADLPAHILSLYRSDSDEVEVLVHDFFMISPSYTLLDSDNVYRGVPTSDALSIDAAHQTGRGLDVDSRLPQNISLAQWQQRWLELLNKAQRIVVFSDNSRTLLTQAYPQITDCVLVEPHQNMKQANQLALRRCAVRGPVIGVLGNIGTQKGLSVISEMSKSLIKGEGLVVFGQIAPTHKIHRPSKVHGGYKLEDLLGLVERYGITCWAIPSIWPETFSFTTHEALATGFPTFTFDLGAQADAARCHISGHIVEFDSEMELAPAMLDAIRRNHQMSQV